jgi:hypothetical protein
MIDQRITVPTEGMVFGDTTKEMVEQALNRLPATLRSSYEPALIIAASSGRLRPVWKIGQRHKNFPARYYGKVTFTRKATTHVQSSLF